MAWHLENRFIDHTRIDGLKKSDAFVNPVTKELTHLSDKDRLIAMVILNLWPNDKNKRELFFPIEGKVFTRLIVGRLTGGLCDDSWRNCLLNLESAGVFEITRTEGHSHVFRCGPVLDCERWECNDPTGRHFPDWASDPSMYPRGVPTKPRGLLDSAEKGPLFDGDIKNLKNLNEPLTTETEVSEVLGVAEKVLEVEEIGKKGVATLEETWGDWQEGLPENWIKWVLAAAQKKGRERPSSLDIAHAQTTFEETGRDLESDGPWSDGRPNPKSKMKED